MYRVFVCEKPDDIGEVMELGMELGAEGATNIVYQDEIRFLSSDLKESYFTDEDIQRILEIDREDEYQDGTYKLNLSTAGSSATIIKYEEV